MFRELRFRLWDLADAPLLNILETTQNESLDFFESSIDSAAVCREQFVTDFLEASLSFFEFSEQRTTLLPLCFQLLGSTAETLAEGHASSTDDAPDLYRCPKCEGPMKVIERLTPAEIQLRSPPLVTAAA